MKNKLALFDLDGTLYDTSIVNARAYGQAIKDSGYKFDEDLFLNQCQGSYYRDFLPLFKVNPADIEIIHQKKQMLYTRFLSEAKENRHLFNIIQYLKNEYYLAIVTTASKKNCTELLTKFARDKCFDLIISQEDVSHVKPDPEGFLKAMEKFSSSPFNTIIFEDSIAGIEAAKKTGAVVFSVMKF